MYEKIDLIRPNQNQELLADLEVRTGLKIKRITIGKIDFLRDIADIKVYYDDLLQEGWLNSEELDMGMLAKDDGD